MDVIFLQDVPNVANAGDQRRVADGFARNYLLPKKLAALATPEMLKRTERIKQVGEERRGRETGRLEELASHLEGLAVNVTGRVAPTGLFYGAISQTQIANALTEATGREIDRKIVEVLQPIREPGEYEISLNLGPDVSANIFIVAEAEV